MTINKSQKAPMPGEVSAGSRGRISCAHSLYCCRGSWEDREEGGGAHIDPNALWGFFTGQLFAINSKQ
ncbi:hypothetical protein EYF80_001714 [Liparis tanakae]|uniref:Uncharacterized protein n=1 Tax=Liparis tanakae TaxID=230148 RepID=A0A4Z2JED0_9TELE|nr:hypothetical protein EYF80_001714 [Liparis tanakae]